MAHATRRSQPPITIRSARAAELLRRLAVGGRSQAAIIEEALERLVSRKKTLADALAPEAPHDFEWEPPRSAAAGRPADLDGE